MSPQNSCIEILIPSAVVHGGGAFGGWWGHKGGALVTGVTACIKVAAGS